jgi:hypothetical protein
MDRVQTVSVEATILKKQSNIHITSSNIFHGQRQDLLNNLLSFFVDRDRGTRYQKSKSNKKSTQYFLNKVTQFVAACL